MQFRLSLPKRYSWFGMAAGIILTTLLVTACQEGYSGAVSSVSIGTTKSEVNTLILIAQAEGYFASNGLDVDHEIYASGVAALDGMLNHEVDLATGSEFAFAGQILAGQDVRTIGSISRSSIEYLVGRVDRGIDDITDLKGKTIGVPMGSRPEFALDRFLYFKGLGASDVSIVDVGVTQSVAALVNGTVDAVAAWQPYIDQMREQMGGQVVSWSVQEDQPSYTLVMCRPEWTVDNPDVIDRFLKSLIQAEDYVRQHPEEARTFVQNAREYTADYMASVWPDYRFSVSLDQTLVVAMEDQARWIIDHDLTGENETPNFVSNIYFDGLQRVKPEAVNIIR